MAFANKHLSDILNIIGAGGSIKMNGGSKHLSDLLRIAAAAKQSKAMVTFTNMSSRFNSDLVQIATAGAPWVSFED